MPRFSSHLNWRKTNFSQGTPFFFESTVKGIPCVLYKIKVALDIILINTLTILYKVDTHLPRTFWHGNVTYKYWFSYHTATLACWVMHYQSFSNSEM